MRTWWRWGREPGLSVLRAPDPRTLWDKPAECGSNHSPQKGTSPGPSPLASGQAEVGAAREEVPCPSLPSPTRPTQPHRPLQPTARGPKPLCCVGAVRTTWTFDQAEVRGDPQPARTPPLSPTMKLSPHCSQYGHLDRLQGWPPILPSLRVHAPCNGASWPFLSEKQIRGRTHFSAP